MVEFKKVLIEMKKPGAEAVNEEELEKFLLIGKIKCYDDLAERDCLVEYYILTGEITTDCEYARKFLAENDCNLTNTVK